MPTASDGRAPLPPWPESQWRYLTKCSYGVDPVNIMFVRGAATRNVRTGSIQNRTFQNVRTGAIQNRAAECSYVAHLDPVRTFFARNGNVRTSATCTPCEHFTTREGMFVRGRGAIHTDLMDHPRTNISLPGRSYRGTFNRLAKIRSAPRSEFSLVPRPRTNIPNTRANVRTGSRMIMPGSPEKCSYGVAPRDEMSALDS